MLYQDCRGVGEIGIERSDFHFIWCNFGQPSTHDEMPFACRRFSATQLEHSALRDESVSEF